MLWLNFVLFSLIFLYLCFWVWQNDNELKTKGNKILTKNKIDPSTVFSTFDMDKLEKIRRRHWKERLKINKITKLERFEDLHVGGGGGGEGHVRHTNVCKISRLWGAIFSLSFSKSLSNLAALLILKRSFHWCRRIIPNMSKVKKP